MIKQHLPVRTTPWNEDEHPAVWLLGAHGGAGVSTLATFWADWAADANRQWPCGTTPEVESPFVVLVARETMGGLKAAHELILQHHRQRLACQLLGLITVGDAKDLPKPVRQYRDVVVGAAQTCGGTVWQIAWHKHLPATDLAVLPSWHPLNGLPETPERGLPSDVIAAGAGIVTEIQPALSLVLSASSI